jgi:hypothetical protein
VKTTSKGDKYLKAQHYKILTKVVDEIIWIRLFWLHNKLSTCKCLTCIERGKSISYFLHNSMIIFKFTQKTSNRTKCSFHDQLY